VICSSLVSVVTFSANLSVQQHVAFDKACGPWTASALEETALSKQKLKNQSKV